MGAGSFSPLSTMIDPSGLTVTLVTRSPALSAALTARRTLACVKVTARLMRTIYPMRCNLQNMARLLYDALRRY